MKITIGAKILIECPTEEVLRFANENLVFANPKYHQNEILGFSNYRTPKEVRLYKNLGDSILLPYGVANSIYPLIKGSEINLDFKSIETQKKVCSVNLRSYQNSALESLKTKKRGVLVAPCGSGKTLIGLNLANELEQKTLWVAHTLDLVNQAKSVYERTFFPIAKGEVGTIQEGKVDIGKVITFATIQTLSKLDLTEIEKEFNCIIIDECHKVSSKAENLTMYSYVLNRLCARYKFGLTATPKRRDGLTPSMYALLGDKAHEITDHEVESAKIKATLRVVDLGTQESLEYYDESYRFINTKFSDYIATHKQRNAEITSEIVDLYKKGRKQLVLCERIKQVEELENNIKTINTMLPKPIKYAIFIGRVRKSARQELLTNYNDYDLIIATYSIAQEGLDMPTLDTLHLASPKTKNNKGLMKQCVGRVERLAPNKTSAEVIFYRDFNIRFSMRACENVRLAMGVKKRDYIFTKEERK